jgi:hypothetical protein
VISAGLCRSCRAAVGDTVKPIFTVPYLAQDCSVPEAGQARANDVMAETTSLLWAATTASMQNYFHYASCSFSNAVYARLDDLFLHLHADKQYRSP